MHILNQPETVATCTSVHEFWLTSIGPDLILSDAKILGCNDTWLVACQFINIIVIIRRTALLHIFALQLHNSSQSMRKMSNSRNMPWHYWMRLRVSLYEEIVWPLTPCHAIRIDVSLCKKKFTFDLEPRSRIISVRNSGKCWILSLKFTECIGSGSNPSAGLVSEFANSLSGFLLVFNREGKILFSSDNILDYLGHTVVSSITQIDSPAPPIGYYFNRWNWPAKEIVFMTSLIKRIMIWFDPSSTYNRKLKTVSSCSDSAVFALVFVCTRFLL